MYNQFNYSRRKTTTVKIGNLFLGGEHPIKVQSMATTDTNDTENSVAQGIRIIEAGGEIVRYTAQGIKEAENLKNIHEALTSKGFDVPLVADIHFIANAADVAAKYVEKVRVNPGNFVGAVRIAGDEYTEEEYQAEFEKLKGRFVQLLQICKQHGTAIRIGVNHGSLSERMMNRWGDTPRGMVESCLELLAVCVDEDFTDVVISMKASNTLAMVHAVRLLIYEMEKRNFKFPLHLGVTEAGDGEDGRIKSSVGIGALLQDGIGDTIRVSLSEEPEAEIPVARALVDYVVSKAGCPTIDAVENEQFSRFEYTRRATHAVGNIGGENVPVVLMNSDGGFATIPDYLLRGDQVYGQDGNVYPVFSSTQLDALIDSNAAVKFLRLSYPELSDQVIALLKSDNTIIVLLTSTHQNSVGEMRAFFHTLLNHQVLNPVILSQMYDVQDIQALQIKSASDLGVLFLDGFGDGLHLELKENNYLRTDISIESVNAIAFGILQASRVRVSKTEYISCPSCGRTLFNLQTVIAKVKAATSHLKGLKIGIMGCIVNGPGEMADADYGYVGAGRGKVSLYKKKVCLQRNIDEDEAVDRLVQLIKENGDWHDK